MSCRLQGLCAVAPYLSRDAILVPDNELLTIASVESAVVLSEAANRSRGVDDQSTSPELDGSAELDGR